MASFSLQKRTQVQCGAQGGGCRHDDAALAAGCCIWIGVEPLPSPEGMTPVLHAILLPAVQSFSGALP